MNVKGGVKGSQCGGVKVVQWKVIELRGEWRLERSGRRHSPRSVFGGWTSELGLLGVGGAAFALALLEAEAVAVHLQDVDMVSEPIQQGTRQTLRSENLGPFGEGQVTGDQG
jgi:hypothetical protein